MIAETNLPGRFSQSGMEPNMPTSCGLYEISLSQNTGVEEYTKHRDTQKGNFGASYYLNSVTISISRRDGMDLYLC